MGLRICFVNVQRLLICCGWRDTVDRVRCPCLPSLTFCLLTLSPVESKILKSLDNDCSFSTCSSNILGTLMLVGCWFLSVSQAVLELEAILLPQHYHTLGLQLCTSLPSSRDLLDPYMFRILSLCLC